MFSFEYLCGPYHNTNMNITIENKRNDNPRLLARVLKDGRARLYLQYLLGTKVQEGFTEQGNKKRTIDRRSETLDLYIYEDPKNQRQRAENKAVLKQAYAIRDEREKEFKGNMKGYSNMLERPNLYEFWSAFIKETQVQDKKVLQGTLKNFKEFIAGSYPKYKYKIEANDLTKKMVEEFVDYLKSHHNGQGPETYYRRFKRLINYSIEKGIILNNPCKGVRIMSVEGILSKEILSKEELLKLFATHYKGENPEIRRAFEFTCYSGVRYCDLSRLTYYNVDYANRIIRFTQHKVEGHSKKAGMVIPLTDKLLEIVGRKPDNKTKTDLIFDLPSFTMCTKALRRWVIKADINKHITWHCGRHSFATNLLSAGVNIKVVSDLLGHSTLQHTEIYLRVIDKQKRDALELLSK